jgi:predicted membrane-bound spermidine synthase
MEPWTELARAQTADGDKLVLRQRAGLIEIRCNGWELMANRAHYSEAALAALVCERLSGDAPRILIGGLGLGYTLRAALDRLPASAVVMVAELLPAVIEWNRGVVGSLAGHPLDDRRVSVAAADVIDQCHPAANFAAILLDVDNGPGAIMLRRNRRIYAHEGLQRLRAALAPSGILGVWSADPAPRFGYRLRSAGFDCQSIDVPARGDPSDPHHTIYLARRRDSPSSARHPASISGKPDGSGIGPPAAQPGSVPIDTLP